jgi:hypothetical protein
MAGEVVDAVDAASIFPTIDSAMAAGREFVSTKWRGNHRIARIQVNLVDWCDDCFQIKILQGAS